MEAFYLDLGHNRNELVDVVGHFYCYFVGVFYVLVRRMAAETFLVLFVEDLTDEDDPAQGLEDVILAGVQLGHR